VRRAGAVARRPPRLPFTRKGSRGTRAKRSGRSCGTPARARPTRGGRRRRTVPTRSTWSSSPRRDGSPTFFPSATAGWRSRPSRSTAARPSPWPPTSPGRRHPASAYAWGKPGRLYKGRLLEEGRAADMRAMLLRGGYLGGKSLGDNGEAYEEKALLVEWHLRAPLQGRVLLSHRLRTNLRWLGDDSEFSTRWRGRRASRWKGTSPTSTTRGRPLSLSTR
jgi:hypothetical protein